MGLPALLEWVTQECNGDRRSTERSRRLDSDAAAVQIMTVWVSKGLQYPIVYLPFSFNRNVQDRELVLFHRDRRRCLDIGGKGGPRSEEHTSELQSLMRISYAVFCLKKKKKQNT